MKDKLATSGFTPSLLEAAIGCITAELIKRGLDDNEWATAPVINLLNAFDHAIDRNDWRAMVMFAFMLAARDTDPSAHLQQRLSNLFGEIRAANRTIELYGGENKGLRSEINTMAAEVGKMSVELAKLRAQHQEDIKLINSLNAQLEPVDDEPKRTVDINKQINELVLGINRTPGVISIGDAVKDALAKLKEQVPLVNIGTTSRFSVYPIDGDVKGLIAKLKLGETVPVSTAFRWDHLKPGSDSPNCRCVMAPVEEEQDPAHGLAMVDANTEVRVAEKSKVHTTCVVNCQRKGVDYHWEFEGTPDEIQKAIKELNLDERVG